MPSIVEREYATLTPLDVRIQTHRRYSETAHDVEADVIAAAAITADNAVLDVGPGTGTFLARLAAARHGTVGDTAAGYSAACHSGSGLAAGDIAADLAIGHSAIGSGESAPSRTAPLTAIDFSAQAAVTCASIPGVRALRGDAQHLPFADASFDVVTARHMLYHLDEPVRAIAEARRVLRPGGRFAAVVNREGPYPRMMALLHDVLTRNGLAAPPPVDSRVHGGNLPGLVTDVFDEGRTGILRRDNALIFPAPEPVVAYLASVLTLQGVPEAGPLRAAIVADLDAAARAAFRAQPGGVWRDPKGYVIVTASV